MSHSLQSSTISLIPEGGLPTYAFALDLDLTFSDGVTFSVSDQPIGTFRASQYNPQQYLAAAMLTGFNGPILAGAQFSEGYLTGASAKTTQVPEPGTMALLGAGLIGLGAMRRRRHTQG